MKSQIAIEILSKSEDVDEPRCSRIAAVVAKNAQNCIEKYESDNGVIQISEEDKYLYRK